MHVGLWVFAGGGHGRFFLPKVFLSPWLSGLNSFNSEPTEKWQKHDLVYKNSWFPWAFCFGCLLPTGLLDRSAWRSLVSGLALSPRRLNYRLLLMLERLCQGGFMCEICLAVLVRWQVCLLHLNPSKKGITFDHCARSWLGKRDSGHFNFLVTLLFACLAWESSQVLSPIFLSSDSCLQGNGIKYQTQGHTHAAKPCSASQWPFAMAADQGDPWG